MIPAVKFAQHALLRQPIFGASKFQPPCSLPLGHASTASPMHPPLISFWGTLFHSATCRCWPREACCLSRYLAWNQQPRKLELRDTNLSLQSMWNSVVKVPFEVAQHQLDTDFWGNHILCVNLIYILYDMVWQYSTEHLYYMTTYVTSIPPFSNWVTTLCLCSVFAPESSRERMCSKALFQLEF